MAEPYDAQAVLDKIEWEGPEGIEWFHADDSIDPGDSSELYDAVNDARSGWAQYTRAIDEIERIAKERNHNG